MTMQERAEAVLLDNCCTFSKRVQSYIQGVYCSHVAKGSGNYLTMVDGEEVFDTVSGLGSNLLECRNNFSLESGLSVRVAEKFLEKIEYHHKVKFVKNGSDACQAAVRYARAYTKRKMVAYTGYHGYANVFTSCTPPARGCVPEYSIKFDTIEKLTSYVQVNNNIACCIIEPLELDTTGLLDKLTALREACNSTGTVLVFDEVITGWRVPDFSVANWLGVYPCISCFGKALGGGHPIGIVAVNDSIAENTVGVFVSTTAGGENGALEGMYEILAKVSNDMISDAWSLGTEFKERMNALAPDIFQLRGYPTRFVWEFTSELNRHLVWQEMYKRRILCGAAFFPKLTWEKEQYDAIVNSLRIVCENIKTGAVLPEGLAPKPFFKRV